MNNQRAHAIVRLLAVAITWVNAILTAKGLNPIPFDEGIAGEVVAYVLAGGSAVWAWWKHTNWTTGALVAYPRLLETNEAAKTRFGGESDELDPASHPLYEEPALEGEEADEDEDMKVYAKGGAS